MTSMHQGKCRRCGAPFWESSPGARGDDLCDLHTDTPATADRPQTIGRRHPQMQPNSVVISHVPPTEDLGEHTEESPPLLVDVRKEFGDLEAARERYNNALRSLVHVGQRVWIEGPRGWEEGRVSWVPYTNSPAATHIYVSIPRLKEPRKVMMGGGVLPVRLTRPPEDELA